MSNERIRRLEEIGFVWDMHGVEWDEMFTALVAYKAAHNGDCNVPNRWPENPKLGQWVGIQRNTYKGSKLSPERIQRLEEIGFAWDLLDVAWEEMFAALTAYKERHGDCNVPSRWPENPKLGQWVSTQRNAYRSGQLSNERIRRLEEIGFVWDRYGVEWDEMFAALAAYKAAHGHCNVPSNWPDNPKLGRWVSTQRKAYNSTNLSSDRRRRLEEIGFQWSVI